MVRFGYFKIRKESFAQMHRMTDRYKLRTRHITAEKIQKILFGGTLLTSGIKQAQIEKVRDGSDEEYYQSLESTWKYLVGRMMRVLVNPTQPFTCQKIASKEKMSSENVIMDFLTLFSLKVGLRNQYIISQLVVKDYRFLSRHKTFGESSSLLIPFHHPQAGEPKEKQPQHWNSSFLLQYEWRSECLPKNPLGIWTLYSPYPEAHMEAPQNSS